MFQWSAKFQVQMFFWLRATKKWSCYDAKKWASVNLDASMYGMDMGVQVRPRSEKPLSRRRGWSPSPVMLHLRSLTDILRAD
jgi:hypothetical protein